MHPAFLIEKFDWSYRYGPDDPDETLMEWEENLQQTPREREEYAAAVEAAEAANKVIDDTKKSLDNVQTEVVDEILKDPDFSKVVDEVVKEKRKTEDFENKKKIFQERLNSPDSQWQKYRDVWNQQVKEWFNLLIKNLENDGFFADCKNKSQKNKKIATMKAKYTQIVKNQYETYVWDADEKNFNAYKDKIFSTNDNMSPTNSILYNLRNKDDSNVTRDKLEANATEQKLKEGQEVTSEKVNKRIKFLAHELPNYLWKIKDTNLFKKLFLQMDVPSDTDKEEITNFIKLVDKIDWENAEVKLIEIFNELEKWASDDTIKDKLAENELTLKKDSDISKIKESFNFYVDIMNPYNPVKDQHAVYLNIITIIKKEWWFDKAIAAYKAKVDEYKEQKKQEKKWQKYEKWKILEEDLKSFVDALHSPVDTEDKKVKRKSDKTKYDYTRVTRLNEKTDEYFAQTDIVNILADINNDKEITAADRWTQKTGTQFKEVYETVKNMLWGDENAENRIIDNLLEQAKIYNNMLPDNVKISDEEFTKDQIQQWNKKLILLLQTIISEWWRDLRPLLMCGPEADKKQSELYETLKSIPESSASPEVQTGTKEILKKYGITPETSFDDLQGVTYDSLCQATAWALHVAYLNAVDWAIKAAKSSDAGNESYIKGAGAWTVISFDEWVKWLSLNIWVQWWIKDKSKFIPGFGISLAYSPTFNLPKWWSVTPNTHLWFIMLGPIPVWDAGAWVEFAKKWADKHHVLQNVGWWVGVDYIFPWNTLVFSANVWRSRDKLKWIETDKEKMWQAFNKEIITPLLNNIASKFNGKEFDLTKPENCKLVDEAVDEIVKTVIWDKKSEFTPDDIVKLKETTVRLLINYNKAPIDNQHVRKYISDELSECYASIWTEQNLNALNNKVYLSGLRAGVSFAWLVGSCYFAPALHLWMSFKKHRNDGYGDGSIEKYEIVDVNIKWDHWDTEMIEAFNKYLENDAKLSLTEDWEYIVLSPKVMDKYNICLNPWMKGLMKKDESWNVLLSKETYMNLPRIFRGVANKSTDILIGWWKIEESTRLDAIMSNNDWFTTWDIDIDKLPGKEIEFTIQLVNDVLGDLKGKLPNDHQLQAYQIEESFAANLEKWKKYKITLIKNNDEITRTYEEITTWDPLQIEYIGTEKVELMDPKAQEIANTAYLEARKVESNALYSISHGKGKWESYVKFANAMRDKKYTEAKNIIVDMLPRMDRFINKYQKNKVNFSSMIEDLNKLENEVELWQALLSINNVFARVSSVQWWKEQDIYHFKKYEGGHMVDRPMGEIIERRAGEIERKINKSNLTQDVKNSYTSLIGAMENYRKNNSEYYNATSKERNTLHNAVWINLGNAINIENPLFNPEIYKDSQIALKDLPDFQWKNTLQQHAMEVMARDKSLIWPILKKLNIDVSEWGNEINYKFVNYDSENGELVIKIGEKTVKFRADMSVWYFSQCVNHMILLDNIEAEVEWWNERVKFKAPVNWNGRYEEWTVESIMATSAGHLNFTIWLWKYGKGQQDATTHQEGGTSSWNWDWWSEQWGSTWWWTWDGGDESWSWGGWRD